MINKVFLFENDFALRWFQDKNPDVKLYNPMDAIKIIKNFVILNKNTSFFRPFAFCTYDTKESQVSLGLSLFHILFDPDKWDCACWTNRFGDFSSNRSICT